MNKRLPPLLLLLFAFAPVQAQWVDTSRFHVQIATGVGMASGFGQTQALSWVAPSFELHPTERLTVHAGFANAYGGPASKYALKGLGSRDLAPRREGTQATAVWLAAEYQVNDRLWLWGAVAHLGGFSQPLWLDHSVPLQATAFSGGFGYRIGENSLIEMHFTLVRDTYGTALGPLYSPYHDPFAHSFPLMTSPWAF